MPTNIRIFRVSDGSARSPQAAQSPVPPPPEETSAAAGPAATEDPLYIAPVEWSAPPAEAPAAARAAADASDAVAAAAGAQGGVDAERRDATPESGDNG